MTTMTTIGSMDREITLQSRTSNRDAAGGEILSWSNVATVWAEVVEAGGREFFASDARRNETMKRFTMHFISGVTPRHRIVYAGENYDIRRIAEIGRAHQLRIWADTTGE